MISKIKKPVSILLSLIMVFSVFAIVPLSASAAYWYSDLARETLIQPGDTFSFEDIGSFKFADYNDPTIIHEVKGSDFSYNQATLSVTDGYYSFGSTKLLPTSVSPGGLLVADYDSTTKMATFGVQNITHSFDETTGTLTIGGSGVVPPNYAFTGSDVYGVVFTQSNLVKHLIIDATNMIAIKQDAFMAYTGGCVLEDVVITSTSSAPLTIENNAIFYEKDSAVTITVNAATLPTVTSCPVDNYGSPVNLIYNVQEPITFKQRALSSFDGNLTVTIPTGSKVYIPAAPQFTDSALQTEYNHMAQYGDERFFWEQHSDLVEGTDYVMGEASYKTLTPENVSLVVGDNTAYFSTYAVTDASVNGAVTASVGGTDVTEAEPGSTVLLTVAPDSGYQFKSITAIGAKYGVEEFSDLVALMGDAVFEAAEYADHTEHTCKAEDGKFVVYNGTTPVTELSESDITDVSGLSGNSPMITCGNIRWSFGISDGKITSIEAVNTSGWDYLFESANDSESTGTLPPADFALTTVTEGSQYSFTMQKRAVTVKAEFEAIPAPAPAKLILNVGENGKVVMDNGTFGNATDASNITEKSAPVNVIDGSKVFIVDGHSVNLVEGGSINIATGGEVSFYPSADNTGKITAIPDEGYICTGWYNGDTRYTTKDTIDYQEISEDMTLTAKFAPNLFPQHSITLGGNIGVNFYIDSAAADFANASTAVVKFTWDNGNYNEEVDLKALTPDTSTGYYKATVDVVAAHMAHEIHAEVYLDGEKLDQTDDYSVQDYAETVFANPEKYDNKNKPKLLAALAQALLNYGANAQTVFDSALTEKPALANKTVGNNGYEGVTADQIEGAIKGSAFTVSDVETALGAKFYTSSLIYLSRNTLRLYFTPTTYPGEIPNAGAYAGNLSGYYYYVDAANIPAAELDNQQTFSVNGTEFTFSALDYAYAVVESDNMTETQKNLAKSLYLYNQAANAYFDDEEPAPHTHDFTYAADGATITATCNGAGTCDIDEGLSLTISAPTGELTANGTTTFPATLSTGYNTTAFPDTYTISYTKDGQPFDGTPTEAGAYTASVTVGTATASVSYTVAAPVVNYTYWVGPYAQYEHSLLLSVGTELHTGDLIAWEGSGWNQYQVLDSSNNNNQIACFEEGDSWSVTGNYRVTGLTKCFDTDCNCVIYLEPIANN